ncbi:MAG: M28 family peptidase [Gemmatimonadaceae bacterium]
MRDTAPNANYGAVTTTNHAVLAREIAATIARITLDEPWSLVTRFATLRREHPEDVRTAAGELASRLTRLGVPVTVHEPELFLSLPGAGSVRAGAAIYKAKPMAMSVAYRDGITAPLVYAPARYARGADELFARNLIGDGQADLHGKIVVSEGFGMPGKVAHFEENGALGMIAVNPGKNAHWGICTTVWGTPDLRDLPRKPTLAVVAVNNADGLALIESAKQGREATLTSDVTEGWFRSPVPVVTIPGNEEPEPFVLLHGHYDAWDVGVGDNAVGDAALLEIARVLWESRQHLKRSVRIAWWPGHSTGRYAGSTWFADSFAIDLYERCIAQVNCDSPGCRWATVYKDVSWMDEAAAFARGVIRAVTGQEAHGERPHQAGDYSFNNIGITSFFMLLSTMPDELRESQGYYGVGGCGGNIAWHTEEDLLDIADRDILLKDMRIYCAAVMAAANATIAPFDFRLTLDSFAATLSRYASATCGRFDFSAAQAALGELRDTLERFSVHTRSIEEQPVASPPVRRANAALRRLARLLVPVNYTRGTPFFHDAAESIPALPDLHPALTLGDAPPDRVGFIITHLTRGQNRLVAALRDARRVVEDAMT